MHCPECGHINPANADCCASCGAPLTPAETTLNPGETRRDPDDLSFPEDAGDRGRRAARAVPSSGVVAGDLSGGDDVREPRFLDARRPRPPDSTATMRDLATRLRPDAPRVVVGAGSVRYAGFVRRGIAFVIDLIVLTIFTIPLTVAGLVAMRTGLTVADLPRPFATDEALTQMLSVGGAVMFVVYFTVLHAGAGQTIGKAALGIGVRSVDLRTIGLFRSALRVLGYFASAAVFGLGFAMIAFTPKKRGWHDYVAGTCVVRLVPKEV